MICKWTEKPCDPESYVCHYLDRTFELTQNESCKHLISEEEAEG